ncbi:hypothetical protein ASPWEDRAFT_119066 [Aspergillus wentii DTO 134E9]|uniref:Alpha-1,6-mannosyltransferase subunit n=1 Tax=Aspergillus wentii DTO 134E9 TaxID=1073089 RepID=A0A1L9R9C1_ASPWE|nr:uncharacterized protein ASPWEDRAFT_119066 [Aspergillus wentii DTO 134E9]OJJ31488.1 hypothetical protein ASPWEDRAFT_119066 [Aspergillus wentii DTO 134E9]
MSLSRSPSPHPGGGWSSPAVTPGSGTSTPHSGLFSPGPMGPSGVSWAAAKAKSEEVRGYPSFSTRNNGFFSRSKRKISASLPRFSMTSAPGGYVDKDDFGRGKFPIHGAGQRTALGSMLQKRRIRALLGLVVIWLGYLFFWTSIIQTYRHSALGGGSKFVVVLGSNVEGGVMEWKGAREWAIERNSIWNKKKYTQRWGYELEVVNMLAKKRYSHEWRESWEKVDSLREAMRRHPDAEWFWWLDLGTWVMEYSYSLQDHIFNHLDSIPYRDINLYNPLNISHPPTDQYLDEVSRSPDGDKDTSSIHMLLSQDCGGFNLGSFMMRRSVWTDRLLDTWWDPVMYEQKHMEWEHKEQDALEYLYESQPWVRSGVAFLPQRYINSFPEGACGDERDPGIHYNQDDRDFVVNMAGCKFGRDCWGEMYQFREHSNWLNRTRWERFKDALSGVYNTLFGKGEKQEQ